MKNKHIVLLIASVVLIFTYSCGDKTKATNEEDTELNYESEDISQLKISDNHHYFTTESGKPFFWLGDTGWLLFSKLNREEAVQYLDDRKKQGYNVIQVMVLHTLAAANVYGDSALVKENVAKPLITPGADFDNTEEYDFWDHVDYVVQKAKENNLYMAMVPVWGNNVKDGKVTKEQAKVYSEFLADRYKDYDNVIWLNGGDTYGNEYTDVWNTIGYTLKEHNPKKLQTFHPRGRMQSSDWFHDETWLDFNMIQSGHRRYDQDDTERAYGEDNWKYIAADFYKKPIKPTLDGEPSYEGIPQGLHDTLQPFWKAKDVRRYGYWSVFAGAAGYTYGHSAVMQMHRKIDSTKGAYGNKMLWTDALKDEGATQMQYIKKLMLSYPYFDRVPDTTMVLNQGEKYDRVLATKGKDYAMFYTYTGRTFDVKLGILKGDNIVASWYDPRTGKKTSIGEFKNHGTHVFDPEGDEVEGNDWVLILQTK